MNLTAAPGPRTRRLRGALRRLSSVAAVGLMAMLTLPALARAQSSPQRPNIVVILADDLGYGDLASYGHPSHRTPHLDAMARDGVRATAAYAPSPSCSPTRASLLTGRYAFRVGIRAPLSPRSPQGLRASDVVTLPRVLKDAGYKTMVVGKWHLGDQPGMRPLEHGFDRFVGLLYSHDYKAPFVQTPERLALWDGETRRIEEPDPATLTSTYTEEAVTFIKAQAAAKQPFFLYLAHSMPHVPLAVSPRWRGRTSSAYGDVMAELDDSIGRVRAALAATGVADNTLVIFTSDNGPWNAMPERMFGSPDVKPWDHGTTGPFRGGKAGTYEGGHRVPFIATWSGQLPTGRTMDAPISLVDLLPTVAGRTGTTPRLPSTVDGKDTWPLLTGASAPDGLTSERVLLYDNLGHAEAIRIGPWKLRLAPAPAGATPKPELFHLLNDPSERYDVSAAHPDIVDRLRQRLASENASR
ncbi:MAG TPA: sulfatase-like hydrolase/transferase [Luteitalea sp.]|nr:sulfatase-like hydrolase/transferase [Luteitalea sp.]